MYILQLFTPLPPGGGNGIKVSEENHTGERRVEGRGKGREKRKGMEGEGDRI